MKATYDWIREYVPAFQGDVREMCERFTMSGTEVEYFEQVGDDWVIEFAVTSNRVDCLGVLGLARELAAATGLPFVPPRVELDETAAAADEVCSVAIEDLDLCSRYTARIIEGVVVGPSPDWMVKRLEAIGLRSINNIVDATNYALFETNQPFHAFDLDRLKDGAIVVRRARKGESIRALNDKVYELDSEMLAITDPSGPVAIAGVMGGAATEVGEGTTRVLLETAWFEPMSIRASSRRLGLASDSSFRFERGIDRGNVDRAAGRCAQLIVQVAGGRHRRGLVAAQGEVPAGRVIPFRHDQVKRITGIDIPLPRCLEIFTALDCATVVDDPARISVVPPSWRGDLEREIDLVEEVIRIHGLEALPVESGMRVMTVKEGRQRKIQGLVKNVFVAAGFHETLTTSFLAEDAARASFFAKATPITIANAMRKDENALRQSLLHSLLAVRKTNQDHGNDEVRIFEATVVYLDHDGRSIPEHLPIVGAALDGGLREARGVVERLLRGLGIEGSVFGRLDEEVSSLLDPTCATTLRLADGRVLGHLGRPDRRIAAAHDLKSLPCYLELRLDRLSELASLEPKYRPLSRYPAVKRDLAIVVDEGLLWQEVESLVRSLELADLDAVEFFDEYRGKQVGTGKKSLAFSLTYRSHERTLTGDEVDASQQRLIAVLGERFGAQIRA
ncbi:MAG: phenylalanine--tRNA ligase subunit beta [Planctomycetes bacterium]|nr:phenylalanine--tRNA ligase subunit beta [Planctomycetota bacterium]